MKIIETNNLSTKTLFCGLLAGCVFFDSVFCMGLFSLAVSWFLSLTLSSFRERLKTTFLFFWGYFLVALYWIPNALFVELHSFWWLIPLCLVGIPALLAIIYTTLSFLFCWHTQTGVRKVILFALFWVSAEVVSSFIFTGFPWALLGYAWHNLYVLQLASFMGVYGLSFFSVLLLSAPYVIQHTRRYMYFGIMLSLFGMVYGYGAYKLYKYPTRQTEVLLRVVQPNIPQVFKWDPLQKKKNLQQLFRLSTTEAAAFPQVILWPEAAFDFNIEANKKARESLAALLRSGSFLISGNVRYMGAQVFNSLFVLNSTGEIVDFYDKHHLVPFGEYIPLRRWLEKVFPKNYLRKITAGIGDFGEGKGPRTLHIDTLPSFSPLICYEAIFPRNVKDRQKPTWLLNVTNDAWFGDSIGPEQHLQIARLRAIEEGLPLVRVANTGISAVIDPCGRMVATLPLNTEGIIDTHLPQPLPEKTFFS